MAHSNTNCANRFPPQVPLLLSQVRIVDKKSRYSGKIVATVAIPFFPLKNIFLFVIHAFGVHPTL
jgi:hypothetical protein